MPCIEVQYINPISWRAIFAKERVQIVLLKSHAPKRSRMGGGKTIIMFVHKGGVAFSAARAGVDTDALLCVRAGGPYPKRGCLIEGRCINYFTRRCFKVLFMHPYPQNSKIMTVRSRKCHLLMTT